MLLFKRYGKYFFRNYWPTSENVTRIWKKVSIIVHNLMLLRILRECATYCHLIAIVLFCRPSLPLKKESNPSFQFWWQYTEMVCIIDPSFLPSSERRPVGLISVCMPFKKCYHSSIVMTTPTMHYGVPFTLRRWRSWQLRNKQIAKV